ncbi:MAG: NAD(P)-binding domain-containing protein, partial [Acidimicrobiales bacterium]
MRIAVLGLGRMGWHMAAHLSSHADAHELVVFDVVDGLAGRWVDENGGEVADSVASAVTGAEFVITSLPADRELETVADDLVPAIAAAAVWVDHSTTSARLARAVGARVTAADAHFL